MNETEEMVPEELPVESDNDDCGAPSYFEEEEQCVALLESAIGMIPLDNSVLLPSPGEDADGAASLLQVKFASIINRYQENPHLILPYLETLITPLVELFLKLIPTTDKVVEAMRQLKTNRSDGGVRADVLMDEHALGQNLDMFDSDAPRYPLHLVSGALYTIIKTAGEKNCTSYFPSEVKYYEDVFYTLKLWKEDPSRRREWEVRYALLLWLSNLVLVPFELSIIDSSTVTEMEDTASLSLSDATLYTAVAFLSDSTKCREGAALLIARLATRPDSARHRDLVFRYARDILANIPREDREKNFLSDITEKSFSRPFLVQGVLEAIAKTLKLGQRQELVQYAGDLIPVVISLVEVHKNDSLICKTTVKVTQRLVLSMLQKKRAAWRYKKNVLSLAANLGGAQETEETTAAEDNGGEFIEGDVDTLEEGLGYLLESMGHKDTIVRWCAAKGIGRVCERLPTEMVDEILGGVQEAFTTDFDDMSWHGGLLAFAELCRRGVLPAAYLEEVVPVIAKGLAFDWSKGTYSVGAHVRDAASYVCWSLARAYDAADIEPHVYRLSVTLVITSLFDREVNVRRAASAAFQECVGRLGNFPHGIDLVTTMDFFSLSSLKSSYLEVAPKVAQFEAYRPSMLSALVETKLSHWDTAVRQCAAGALGELAVLEVQYMHENVFPVLLERVVDPTVAIRHGALLGIVHLIRRLPMESWTKEELSDIAEIVVRLDAARLFRSRGGEYIREACCLILSACADVQLPLPELVTFTKISGEKGRAKTHKKVQEFYEDTWKNILEWVQRSATDSFSKYAQVYYREYDPAFHSKVLAKIMEGCGPGNPLERRGFLSAAGGVPPSWLMAKDVSDDTYYYYQQLMKVLQEAALVDPTSDAELADAETRRNAVYSIGGILSKLPDGATVDRQWFADVSGTLLHSIQDYAVDKRGDVGSFVRLATLEIFPLVVQKGLTLSVCSDAIFLKFLKAVIRCAMEKLDKVRAAAVRTAQRLLGDCDWLSLFPESDERREIQFCQQLIQETAKEVVDISSPQLILSALAPPLLESCPVVFSYSVMEGLIVSAGDLSEHIRRPATGVLRDSFRGSSATETVSERQARLSRYLVEIGEGYVHCERVLVPLSRALDICVNDAVFALSCQMRVVEILRAELRHYATTIQVLLPLTSLLATMGRCGDPAAQEATWKLLLTMIASRYPKVRGKVATEFYTSLLVLSSTGETAGVDAERCHRAMEHLSKVQWDGSDAGKIRSARNALYEILDIAPSAKVEGDTEMTSVKANNSSKAAVAGSYLHLVREAGY